MHQVITVSTGSRLPCFPRGGRLPFLALGCLLSALALPLLRAQEPPPEGGGGGTPPPEPRLELTFSTQFPLPAPAPLRLAVQHADLVDLDTLHLEIDAQDATGAFLAAAGVRIEGDTTIYSVADFRPLVPDLAQPFRLDAAVVADAGGAPVGAAGWFNAAVPPDVIGAILERYRAALAPDPGLPRSLDEARGATAAIAPNYGNPATGHPWTLPELLGAADWPAPVEPATDYEHLRGVLRRLDSALRYGVGIGGASKSAGINNQFAGPDGGSVQDDPFENLRDRLWQEILTSTPLWHMPGWFHSAAWVGHIAAQNPDGSMAYVGCASGVLSRGFGQLDLQGLPGLTGLSLRLVGIADGIQHNPWIQGWELGEFSYTAMPFDVGIYLGPAPTPDGSWINGTWDFGQRAGGFSSAAVAGEWGEVYVRDLDVSSLTGGGGVPAVAGLMFRGSEEGLDPLVGAPLVSEPGFLWVAGTLGSQLLTPACVALCRVPFLFPSGPGAVPPAIQIVRSTVIQGGGAAYSTPKDITVCLPADGAAGATVRVEAVSSNGEYHWEVIRGDLGGVTVDAADQQAAVLHFTRPGVYVLRVWNGQEPKGPPNVDTCTITVGANGLVVAPCAAVVCARVLVTEPGAPEPDHDEVHFRAYDGDGADVTAAVAWRTSDPNLGVVTPAGVFTPGSTPMTGEVIAEQVVGGEVVASARATVRVIGDELVLDPAGPVELCPQDSADFDAWVCVEHRAQRVDSEVAWSVSPADLGAVSADGGFQPVRLGVGAVRAQWQGKSAEAAVRVDIDSLTLLFPPKLCLGDTLASYAEVVCDGRPVAGVSVEFSNDTPEIISLVGAGPSVSDADGRAWFTIKGEKLGVGAVRARLVVTVPQISPRETRKEIEIHLEPPILSGPTALCLGEGGEVQALLTCDGQPVEGQRIRFWTTTAERITLPSPAEATTDANGIARLSITAGTDPSLAPDDAKIFAEVIGTELRAEPLALTVIEVLVTGPGEVCLGKVAGWNAIVRPADPDATVRWIVPTLRLEVVDIGERHVTARGVFEASPDLDNEKIRAEVDTRGHTCTGETGVTVVEFTVRVAERSGTALSFLPLNYDDDDLDGTPDLANTVRESGDNEPRKIEVTLRPAGKTRGKLKAVREVGGRGTFRLFRNAAEFALDQPQPTWGFAGFSTFEIEGTATSATPLDAGLTLEYEPWAGGETSKETRRFTVGQRAEWWIERARPEVPDGDGLRWRLDVALRVSKEDGSGVPGLATRFAVGGNGCVVKGVATQLADLESAVTGGQVSAPTGADGLIYVRLDHYAQAAATPDVGVLISAIFGTGSTVIGDHQRGEDPKSGDGLLDLFVKWGGQTVTGLVHWHEELAGHVSAFLTQSRSKIMYWFLNGLGRTALAPFYYATKAMMLPRLNNNEEAADRAATFYVCGGMAGFTNGSLRGASDELFGFKDLIESGPDLLKLFWKVIKTVADDPNLLTILANPGAAIGQLGARVIEWGMTPEGKQAIATGFTLLSQGHQQLVNYLGKWFTEPDAQLAQLGEVLDNFLRLAEEYGGDVNLYGTTIKQYMEILEMQPGLERQLFAAGTLGGIVGGYLTAVAGIEVGTFMLTGGAGNVYMAMNKLARAGKLGTTAAHAAEQFAKLLSRGATIARTLGTGAKAGFAKVICGALAVVSRLRIDKFAKLLLHKLEDGTEALAKYPNLLLRYIDDASGGIKAPARVAAMTEGLDEVEEVGQTVVYLEKIADDAADSFRGAGRAVIPSVENAKPFARYTGLCTDQVTQNADNPVYRHGLEGLLQHPDGSKLEKGFVKSLPTSTPQRIRGLLTMACVPSLP
ncbi:MAG: hypothetical protein HZA54_10780 [Planctomycetes bacterium]|nr:hypothetical protein [Planctomycetota bacterium]